LFSDFSVLHNFLQENEKSPWFQKELIAVPVLILEGTHPVFLDLFGLTRVFGALLNLNRSQYNPSVALKR